MVNALITLMHSNKNITGPYNAGNPNEITMSELALKIKHIQKVVVKLYTLSYLKMIH